MGKILIGLAVLTLPVTVSLIPAFSETLTTIGVAISMGSQRFRFLLRDLCWIPRDQVRADCNKSPIFFVNPLRIRPNAAN